MYIPPVQQDKVTSRQSSRRPGVSASKAQTSLFAQMLTLNKTTTIRRSSEEQLEELWQELEEAEQCFALALDRPNFEKYRAVVRKLTSYLIQHSYEIQRLKNKSGTKVYEVVQIIDLKLSQLQQTFLRRRDDVVIALHLMGEIRGLVVDFFS